MGTSLTEGATIAKAFSDGIDAVSTYGGAKVGDRTMIDALKPASTALLECDLTTAAKEARRCADKTRDMLVAGAGRSAYLRTESLKGIIDPGAEAIARIFKTLNESLK